MGPQDLAAGLRDRKYEVEERQVGDVRYVIARNYVVQVGRFKGQTIQLGFPCPVDFPITPPGGIHTNPQLLQPGPNAIHVSPLGGEWSYWSRPVQGWIGARTNPVSRLMSHVNTLMQGA